MCPIHYVGPTRLHTQCCSVIILQLNNFVVKEVPTLSQLQIRDDVVKAIECICCYRHRPVHIREAFPNLCSENCILRAVGLAALQRVAWEKPTFIFQLNRIHPGPLYVRITESDSVFFHVKRLERVSWWIREVKVNFACLGDPSSSRRH